jgi:hypothetical protein
MAQEPGTQLECPYCGATFSNQNQLREHEQECGERD